MRSIVRRVLGLRPAPEFEAWLAGESFARLALEAQTSGEAADGMSDSCRHHRHSPIAARLRALTPARVGLGRTGVSLETRDLLDFQRAHAQARDAVQRAWKLRRWRRRWPRSPAAEVLRLHSAAPDRATYLQRPDLGRRLDEPSRAPAGRAAPRTPCDLALIVADGLSALAVERHAAPLLAGAAAAARRLAAGADLRGRAGPRGDRR